MPGAGDDTPSGLEGTLAVPSTSPPPSGLEGTLAAAHAASSPSGLEGTLAANIAEPVSGVEATIAPERAHERPPESADRADPLASAATIRGADDLPIVAREHYRMISEFARGGLGRIIKARDKRTGRIVAVKETLTASDDAARRFAREALITANLQHPAIVPVYELGRWPSGEPFYAMKLVAGRSFEDVIAGAPTLDARLAHLSVVISVAEALAFAHDKQVIHRDLKPANVLVGDFGETVVIDWGLAKNLGADDAAAAPTRDVAVVASGATIDGAVMGTPHYMPPEQARGERVDARADVYAIGAMLYQLIAGVRPFGDRASKNVGELLALVAAGTPTPLRELQPTAPPDLLTIAAKAMAADQSARYASAGELAEDLRRFTTGQLVRAHHYGRRALLRRWLRRNRAPVTVAAALLVLAVIGAVISIQRILDERATAVARQHDAELARAEANAQTLAARQSLGQALYDKALVAESARRWAPAALYYASAARTMRDPAKARWAAGLAFGVAVFPKARHVGHADAVTGAAFATDGTRVFTVDAAGDLHAWTPDTGALVGSRRFDRALGAIAASPRGDELAIGDGAGDIVRVDAATFETRAILRGHKGRIWQLAYSPDGSLLASASEDKTARIWRGDTTAHVLRGHTQRVYTVAFSSDGKRAATGGDDHGAWSWDVASGTGALLGTHSGGGVRAIMFVGDDVLSTGWDYAVHIWKRDGSDDVVDWHDAGSVHAAAISPDGRVLVTAGDAPGLRVWDLATHGLLAAIDAPNGRTQALAFSPDGRRLVSGGEGNPPVAWDTTALPRLDPRGHRSRVRRLRFSRDGELLATSGDDGTLRTWNVHTFEETSRVSTGRVDCNEGVLLADDHTLIAGCGDHTIRRWRANRPPEKLVTDVDLRFSALSPDGTQAAFGHNNGRLAVVDLGRFALIEERTAHAHHIYNVEWSRDGIVTASLDDHVKTWRMPGLVPDLDVVAKSRDGLLCAARSPDGAQIAMGSEDGAIFVWDVARASWLARDVGRAEKLGTIWALAYSPDGAFAYSTSANGELRRWDARTWSSSTAYAADEGASHGLEISPDGATIVVGYASGAIVVFDRAAMTIRTRIGGRTRERGSCTTLATEIWRDPTQRALVAAACSHSTDAVFDEVRAGTHQRMDELEVRWDW